MGFESFARIFGKFISIILHPKLFIIFQRLLCICYSEVSAKSFKSVGKGFLIDYPANLFGTKNCVIGKNFRSNKDLRIEIFSDFNGVNYTPSLFIGNNVAFNYRCHIGCINKIEIHDGCLFGSNILITDHNHGTTEISQLKIKPQERKLFSPGEIIIYENVWVGENVAILPNTIIGKGCIIGANSVVKGVFPPNSVIAGVPAKIIKNVF